jgi:hypothetical protein
MFYESGAEMPDLKIQNRDPELGYLVMEAESVGRESMLAAGVGRYERMVVKAEEGVGEYDLASLASPEVGEKRVGYGNGTEEVDG